MPTPPDDTGSALAEQLRKVMVRWGLVAAGLILGGSGLIYGALAHHAAVFIVAFLVVAAALCASDPAVDAHNHEVHDALDASGRFRVGYEREEVR